MRILPINVIPIFLNQGTITGQIGAQVKMFDVYYTTPPAVGFTVIGCENDNFVAGFSVTTCNNPQESVTGFTVITKPRDYGLQGFTVESEDLEDTVKGFSVVREDKEQGVVGFSVSSEEESDTIKWFSVTYEVKDTNVLGFIVEGN